MEEVWKDIEGYEGLYVINKTGKVLSVRTKKEKKPYLLPNGYLQIKLHKNSKRKAFFVHRLVLKTFGGNPDLPEHTVNHINGVKTDNRIENLEWLSQRDNKLHSTEVLKVGIGEARSQSKLSNADVTEIRDRASSGEKAKSIAKSFSVSTLTIYDVINRKTWKHL